MVMRVFLGRYGNYTFVLRLGCHVSQPCLLSDQAYLKSDC